MKQLGALSNKVAAEGNKAKKTVLKGQGGTGAVTNATELAAGIEAAIASTNPKIAAAENKVNTGIANKCDDAQASAATDCNGADTANEVTRVRPRGGQGRGVQRPRAGGRHRPELPDGPTP